MYQSLVRKIYNFFSWIPGILCGTVLCLNTTITLHLGYNASQWHWRSNKMFENVPILCFLARCINRQDHRFRFLYSLAEIHKCVVWGMCNVLLLLLHHGGSVQKPPGDKLSPMGKCFIHGVLFLLWHKGYFPSNLISIHMYSHFQNVGNANT